MTLARENRPLTAIRGVAAVWVVGHHVQPAWFPAATGPVASVLAMGHTAVDIFFVLSGFILAEVYGALPPDQTPVFWLRRIGRVFPLHLAIMAVLGASVIAKAALNSGVAPPHDWVAFGVVSLMLQSFLLDSSPWNPPTWSIGVELACYAAFPLASLLLARAPRRGLATLTLALTLGESLVLYRYDGAIVGAGAILRGLVGFHLGAVLGWLAPALSARAAPATALLGVAGITAGAALASPAAIVLAGAVLIAALAAERGLVARALAAGPLVWLGRVSYSVYLLHALVVAAIGKIAPTAGPWTSTVLLIAILAPLSELTYRLIETPGRRLASLATARRATVARLNA